VNGSSIAIAKLTFAMIGRLAAHLEVIAYVVEQLPVGFGHTGFQLLVVEVRKGTQVGRGLAVKW
jgi:hypothetical protein